MPRPSGCPDQATLLVTSAFPRSASEVEFVKVTQFRVLKEGYEGECVTLNPEQTSSRGPQDKLKPLRCALQQYLAPVKMFRPTANSKLKGKLHSLSQRYQDSPDNLFTIPHQPGSVTSIYQDPDNFSPPIYVSDSHSPTPRSQGSNTSVLPCHRTCSPPPDMEISQSKLLFYKISTSSPTPANLMPDFLMPIPPPVIPSKRMEDDFESDDYMTDIPVPPTVLPPYSMPPSPLPPYPVPPSPLHECSPIFSATKPTADAAKPGTQLPHAAKPGTQLPDAAKPGGTPLPDAAKPGTPLPDAAKPGTPLPDAAKPGRQLPDDVKPGTPLSDAAKPVTPLPDAAKPVASFIQPYAPVLYTDANFSIPDPRQPNVPPPFLAYSSSSSHDSDKHNAGRSRIDLPEPSVIQACSSEQCSSAQSNPDQPSFMHPISSKSVLA
ncbi:hypothetical protein E2C01_045984 [Portunus trituberculatus]|uniref:Uncharacterized protein n=1 Tax=Portunus trituberculatus TaxID=210409 RepID=A0A5B7G4E0_PORTR|nr:hypothetical protein [Portunus trituberculatus]